MTAIRRPVERAAARMLSITCEWLSRSPCAKLSRATFIPALISLSMTVRDSDAGPMVATIFVFWSASFITSLLLIQPTSTVKTSQHILTLIYLNNRYKSG
jgi:hypothetical protein